MRVLSLFSGQGGFDLGLEMAGMEVIGQVENDPQCRKVLAKHWPDVWRAEDVRDVGLHMAREGRRNGDRGTERTSLRAEEQRLYGWQTVSPDLICGGFPCQDLSVAGQRRGLDGDRSGLWFEFQRIVSELRPTYVLIENVPGLLSSNQGRDFAVILNGLGECGYGVSWRVLDSQHFGVAQRRRRVFIVAGPPDGRTEAILAISEGCGGHPQKGRAAGQDLAGMLGGGAQERGWPDDTDRMTFVPEIVGALDTALGHHGYATSAQSAQSGHFLAVRTAQTSSNGWGVSEGTAYTLDGTDGQAVAHTLRADGFDASEDGTGRGTPLVEVSPTVEAHWAKHGNVEGGHSPLHIEATSVRRLTPTECLRLQGFPDDWFDGLGLADGPKYRMCGNAVTVPVIRWLGERIMAADA